MRVLVFGLSHQRGGVESFILSYCQKIKELDRAIHFDYLVIDNAPGYVPETVIPLSDFRVVPNRVKGPLGYRQKLKQVFEGTKYDCFWYNACTLSDITPVKIAKAAGVPVIVHSHNSRNMGNFLNGLLHGMHKKQIEELSTLFLACSKEAGEFLYPASVREGGLYSVLPNSVDTQRFRFCQESRAAIRSKYAIGDEIVFGHVGRFHFQKNHKYLVRVFAAVHEQIPSAKLILVGTGELFCQVKSTVENLGIASSVIFVGETGDMRSIYSAMDFFVFPSLFEGLSLAALEAQASGLPCVISSECEETPVIIEGCKKISIGEDPKKWADSIIKMVEAAPIDRSAAADAVEASGYGLAKSAEKMRLFLRSCGQR